MTREQKETDTKERERKEEMLRKTGLELNIDRQTEEGKGREGKLEETRPG